MNDITTSWPLIRLKDCLKESPQYGANAPSIDYDPKLPRYVRITDITDSGNLSSNDIRSISEEAANGYILSLGDFLFARSGATVGKTYLYRNVERREAYAGYLIRFRMNQDRLLPEYLEQYTKSPQYWTWVQSMIKAGAQPNINAKEYAGLHITLPPLVVQKKIVLILRVWDNAIEKTAKLIETERLRHKALATRLLNSNDHAVSLRKLIKHITRETARPDRPYWVIGIRSHGKGTFRRFIENPNDVAMDTLYQVRHDDLIVNITFAWEGAIALIDRRDEDCLVSHRFPTFEIDKKMVLPEYLRHVIVQKRFIRDLVTISPGGAGRNRVLNKKDFLKMRIPLPDLERQLYIGAVLNTSLREIVLLQTKLDLLNKQKRGLTQKLLTGELRVSYAGEVS